MHSSKQILAGALGAMSTILGEIVTRLLAYYKVGKIDLYQFHSLFLTIDQPSFVLGLIISFIVGSFIAVFMYNCHEKHGPDGIIIRSIMAFILVWLFSEVVFTIFFTGLLDLVRPFNDHYVYLAGMAVSGLTMGVLLKMLIFKKASQSA